MTSNSLVIVPKETAFIVEQHSLGSHIDLYVEERCRSIISSLHFIKYRPIMEPVVVKPPVTLGKDIISTVEEPAGSC